MTHRVFPTLQLSRCWSPPAPHLGQGNRDNRRGRLRTLPPPSLVGARGLFAWRRSRNCNATLPMLQVDIDFTPGPAARYWSVLTWYPGHPGLKPGERRPLRQPPAGARGRRTSVNHTAFSKPVPVRPRVPVRRPACRTARGPVSARRRIPGPPRRGGRVPDA